MPKINSKVRVAITMGDPSGIGPAIIHGALKELGGEADFCVIGDRWVFDKAGKRASDGAGNCRFIDLNNVPRKDFKFGGPRPDYGRASVEYLKEALRLIKEGAMDCMVTCPVSKEAIDSGGISGFRGQTEYLAASTRTKDFLMLLLNGSLRFSLLTRHMPLKDVPSGLTEGNIYRTIILTHRYIKQLFSIRRPRLAVCGLNPHASDNGLLGQEENDIIGPAVERAEKKAGGISGPLPADSAAFKAAQGLYDCVVAIYHDQALIPLKMFRAYGGVNITAGLPFVRCSPLHGTAFDIAAKPKLARPDSLIEAARLAIKCSLSLRKN